MPSLKVKPQRQAISLSSSRRTSQFRKRGWIEFRKDLDEHAALSLAAELQLLGEADMLVGNMGSH